MLATALRFTLVSFVIAGFSLVCVADEVASPTIDSESGLKIDAEENWKLVQAHCGSCHSGRLLVQQSLSREDWLKSIRRMQSNENLWELGDAESTILDYLSENYGTSENESAQTIRRPLLNQSPIESDSDAEQLKTIKNEIETDAEAEATSTSSTPSKDL